MESGLDFGDLSTVVRIGSGYLAILFISCWRNKEERKEEWDAAYSKYIENDTIEKYL